MTRQKKSKWDKTQRLKFWQNLLAYIMTKNPKLKFIKKKLNNSNYDKPQNTNCDKSQKLKL